MTEQRRIRVVAAILEPGPGAPAIPEDWRAPASHAEGQGGMWLLARKAAGKKLAGLWELPGGKIEADESAGAALEREIAEELGLVVEAGDWVATSEFAYDFGVVVLEGWRARVVGGTWRLVDHDLLAWVDAANAGHFELAPADVPLLGALLANAGNV
jgi:8-oxo-dGTP diphosphatase